MTTLEPLAPDQRAVVALVLQQGRSYDEIAALLGIPVDAVRGRAQAGLAALTPGNGLPGEVTGPLADYLLGQQPARDAEATRGLLARSGPARAWAADVAGRLAPIARAPLPAIPAEAGDEAAGEAAAGEATSEAPADEATSEAPGGEATSEAPGGEATSEAPAGEATSEAPGGETAALAEQAPAPRPRPLREPSPPAAADAPPAASRLGGIVLIVAVLAVVGIVLFLVLRGGDEPGDEQAAAPAATATASPTATPAPPQLADEIALRAPAGGDARGTMTVYLQDGRLLFALEAENVPPSSDTSSYAVWFTGPGRRAHRLGFTNPVGADGRLGIQGPSEKDLDRFQRLFATYASVVVSEERSDDAKRPSNIVLAGRLPAGR